MLDILPTGSSELAIKLMSLVGLLRLAFIWLTAYPLLLIERRKVKSLTEANDQLGEIIDRMEKRFEWEHSKKQS